MNTPTLKEQASVRGKSHHHKCPGSANSSLAEGGWCHRPGPTTAPGGQLTARTAVTCQARLCAREVWCRTSLSAENLRPTSRPEMIRCKPQRLAPEGSTRSSRGGGPCWPWAPGETATALEVQGWGSRQGRPQLGESHGSVALVSGARAQRNFWHHVLH
jgi:hypothetical protein